MVRTIVTWTTAETAARILSLSPDAVNDLCLRGALHARRANDGAPWEIDYDALIDYHNAHPHDLKAGR